MRNSRVTTLACDADQVLMFAAICSTISEGSILDFSRFDQVYTPKVEPCRGSPFFWGGSTKLCGDCVILSASRAAWNEISPAWSVLMLIDLHVGMCR